MKYHLSKNEIEKNEEILNNLFKNKNDYLFPAVYSFWDNYNNLLYIGKTKALNKRMLNHIEEGHIDHEFLYKVRKITFTRCNTETDALILETILINRYIPPYNISKTNGECSLIDIEKVVSNLKWETYANISDYDNGYKDKIDILNKQINSFWDNTLTDEKRCNLLEYWFSEYVTKNKPETFRYILERINECYKRSRNNYKNAYRKPLDKFCKLLRNINIPELEINWIQFFRDMYSTDGKNTYIDNAIAANRHMPKDIIMFYKNKQWVNLLDEYDFGKVQ